MDRQGSPFPLHLVITPVYIIAKKTRVIFIILEVLNIHPSTLSSSLSLELFLKQ